MDASGVPFLMVSTNSVAWICPTLLIYLLTYLLSHVLTYFLLTYLLTFYLLTFYLLTFYLLTFYLLTFYFLLTCSRSAFSCVHGRTLCSEGVPVKVACGQGAISQKQMCGCERKL